MYLPKVSIIIPVYNGSNFLGEAIECALSQTYKNIEVIVINDGSNDNGATENVALSYAKRIKYISKQNGGVSSSLNAGIKEASGEWISWLSHDDLYSNDKIEEQIKDIQALKNQGVNINKIMFYCYGVCIDSTGNLIKRKSKRLSEGLHKSMDALYSMFDGYSHGGCNFLLPKGLFEEIGYFDESLRYSQDSLMWQKSYLNGYDLYVNPKVMSFTRIHGQQSSSLITHIAPKDRVKIGNYLKKELIGKHDTKGRSILKKYMMECSKLQIEPINYEIYSYLKNKSLLSYADKFIYKLFTYYGKIRPKIRTIYYKLRHGIKR